MGDGLKLVKDRRHRSSSSIAGPVVDGTRSERKLDIRASIPEVDDQFVIAEARCHDLLEKIDLVKMIKRKKKLKKRSATRVIEVPEQDENIPFIRVHTQPKKKVSQAARLRRLETTNPTRGYPDLAAVEQHRMIGQVRGYNQTIGQREFKNKPHFSTLAKPTTPNKRGRRGYANGDASTSVDDSVPPPEVACGDDNAYADFPDDVFDLPQDYSPGNGSPGVRKHAKVTTGNRRIVSNKVAPKNTEQAQTQSNWRARSPSYRWRESSKLPPTTGLNVAAAPAQEERPVVEIFSKAGKQSPPRSQSFSPTKFTRNTKVAEDQSTGPLREDPNREQKCRRHPRSVKYRSRRYELPTVASQMKQAGVRYYYEHGNSSNIPFVVSKSTTPSHNIGVNIQQVLNGMKIQQPLSGIPLTIAHHMGLGHMPMFGTKSDVMKPSLDIREMNVIRAGKRTLRLPSGRYVSYGRLLALYREGDGLVPRFLRAISRPHYFYTSMFNLATSPGEDADGATSKGQGAADARRRLAEYAALYRQYERFERALKEAYDPEMERRKEELAKELAAREDHIRKKPSLDIREMNVIRAGKRTLRLPSGRYVSYGRLLALYREGDGLVPRFLRAISRPHYFYTSMFNLATSPGEDADGATSKGQGAADARRRLAEYAALYRQYERFERALKEAYDPEMERRKEELAKELAAREDHIRKVVEEYRSDGEQPLRASASMADEGCRHSAYKLNVGDQQQPTFVV